MSSCFSDLKDFRFVIYKLSRLVKSKLFRERNRRHLRPPHKLESLRLQFWSAHFPPETQRNKKKASPPDVQYTWSQLKGQPGMSCFSLCILSNLDAHIYGGVNCCLCGSHSTWKVPTCGATLCGNMYHIQENNKKNMERTYPEMGSLQVIIP